MAWPHLLALSGTCPSCSRTTVLDVLQQPFLLVRGTARLFRCFTWARCPACEHEWAIDSSVVSGALPVA